MEEIEQNKRRKTNKNYSHINLEEQLEIFYKTKYEEERTEIIRYINNNYHLTSYAYFWSIRYNCQFTIRYLIEEFIYCPIECIYEAINIGNIEIVKIIIRDEQHNDIGTREKILKYASGYGSVEIFQEVYEICYKTDDIVYYSFNEQLNDATTYGNIEVVKYICGYYEEPITELHINNALINGHIEIIKYFSVKGIKYTEKNIADVMYSEKITNNINKVDICVYFIQNLHIKYNAEVLFEDAIETANVDIIKYLHMLGNKGTLKNMDLAMERGNINIVKYVHEDMGIEFTDYGMDSALYNNFMDIIEYAYNTGKKCHYSSLTKAYDIKNKKIINFLSKYGCST